MGLLAKLRNAVTPEPSDLHLALAKARREKKILIEEMDAGIRPRNDDVLLGALIDGAITNDEYSLYKLTWGGP